MGKQREVETKAADERSKRGTSVLGKWNRARCQGLTRTEVTRVVWTVRGHEID